MCSVYIPTSVSTRKKKRINYLALARGKNIAKSVKVMCCTSILWQMPIQLFVMVTSLCIKYTGHEVEETDESDSESEKETDEGAALLVTRRYGCSNVLIRKGRLPLMKS